MMIWEITAGMFPNLICGGAGVLCDVAMDPFHRIGSRKGKAARQHLVKRHAKRIEVATRIDGAVHSACLLGRHIGEGAGDDLGWPGGLTLARQRGTRCRSPSA